MRFLTFEESLKAFSPTAPGFRGLSFKKSLKAFSPMNANEARRIAGQRYARETDAVMELIEQTAKLGKFSVTLDKPLSNFSRQYLVDRDFAIGKDENWNDTVSW